MDRTERFCTLINCMDGRTQEPAISWLKAYTRTEFVDSITEAGPDGLLSDPGHPLLPNILDRIRISRDMHGSNTLALVAHHDCAGNPGDRAMHMQHLEAATRSLKAHSLGMRFITLWIDDTWEVNIVSESQI